MNLVKSVEHAREIMGCDLNWVPDFSGAPEVLKDNFSNYYDIVMVIAGMNKINGDWKPDYKNQGPRYYAWPDIVEDKTKPAMSFLPDPGI